MFDKPHDCHGDSNLKDYEATALTSLRTSRNLVVRPSDKGNRWVIMSTMQYRTECLRQLHDVTAYRRIPELLPETAPHVSSILHDLRLGNYLSRQELAFLLPPTSPRPRSFSILAKIHKPHEPDQMPPGRPIVADVKTNSCGAARLLEHFLNPLARKLPSYLRDSFHLLARLRSAQLTPGTLFATLDVRSLYTSIPVEEGIERVRRALLRWPEENRPDEKLLDLLRISLQHNDFLFEDTCWLQTSGVAMGKAFGGSFANIYMGEWETSALATSQLLPSFWVRYQDDILLLWPHAEDALLNFHRHLNAQDPRIQVDLAHDRSAVRFLDLLLFRDGAEVGHKVAFKPTDAHLTLPRSSHHPHHTHRGVLYAQVLRWATLSKRRMDFQATCNSVFPLWRSQGVSRTILRSATRRVYATTGLLTTWQPGFRKCASRHCGACAHATDLTSFTAGDKLYPVLHRLSCATRGCIYAIRCTHCSKVYVGQTGNELRTRIGQHLRNIANTVDTPVARHFRSHDVTNLRFFGIERCASKEKRLTKEAHWIQRFKSAAPAGLNATTSPPPILNLVTFRSICADAMNNAVRHACASEGIRVRFAYRTHPNLRNLLFSTNNQS